MTGLMELVERRENDYSKLAEHYTSVTGGSLVADPLASYDHGPLEVTRSASVLIGSFNSASSLVLELISLERSSFNVRYPDLLEVIVVDDGSTDGTRTALLDLRLNLRWRYVRQQRGGLTNAHNTGLALAEGDVVVFSDSDIVYTPFALEELLKRHEVLPHVTLAGFRFHVEPGDPRLDRDALPGTLGGLLPEFWRDPRLCFPGWPANMARDTRHFQDLGRGRRLRMEGGEYDLPGMVVGALFSLERGDLLRIGGSDERLTGYGAEDTLIGARSLALGNPIVPVYSAAAWHIAHPRRDHRERAQLERNRSTLAQIYAEDFLARAPEPERWRARAVEVVAPRRAPCETGEALPSPYPPPPTTAEAQLLWASAAESVGAFRVALTHLDAAADGGMSAPVGAGRARVLLELGDPDAAIAAASAALTLDPTSGEAAFALARALATQGQHRRAREVLETQAQLSVGPSPATWVLSRTAEEHKSRANYHAQQGLHRIAAVDFDLALVVKPDYEWAHFDQGLSLRALGQTRRAVRSVQRAGQLLHAGHGDQVWTNVELGELYLSLGEHQRARVHLETALRLDPSSYEALAAIEWASESADVGKLKLGVVPIPASVDGIAGWLSRGEMDLLAACAGLACDAAERHGHAEPPVVLELGSFHGRSTVVIATALKHQGRRRLRFFAVDPHTGYHLGDGGDTKAALDANLRQHRVDSYVNIVRGFSHELDWKHTVAFLFIDASHEYEDVRRDYEVFRERLAPGALVAFHDYAPCCPGVEQCVDELIACGELQIVARRDSLIVLSRDPWSAEWGSCDPHSVTMADRSSTAPARQ